MEKIKDLLTKGESSAKLAKDNGGQYLTSILYLASAQYDARLCPAAGACKKAELGLCLVLNSGRTAMSAGQTKGPEAAKIRKTDWFFNRRQEFEQRLIHEIKLLEKRAAKAGLKPAVRLNGGSDLDWTHVYKLFPNVQFWEYTKRPELALKLNRLPNVDVTYSYSETTTARTFKTVVESGINVAVVFDTVKNKPLPLMFNGYPVLDGDQSDLRFNDVRGAIVGLRFKAGKGIATKRKLGVKSGFIQAA